MRRPSRSRLHPLRKRYWLVFGLAAFAGLSAPSATPKASATGLVGAGSVEGCLDGVGVPCKTVVKECEELVVPLEGPSSSACIPAGTYVSGHLRIKTTLYVSTCRTVMKTQTSTCNARIHVPGVGVFTSSEVTYNEVETTPGEIEVDEYGKFRYRLNGCGGDVYTLEYRIRLKVDPLSARQTAHCERVYMDCYTPCCGN